MRGCCYRFTVTIRVARRRATSRPRPAPPACYPPASDGRTAMTRLWGRPRCSTAASVGQPVPNVHRQDVTCPLPVAPFMVAQAFKLTGIVALTHPLFQVHHRRGLPRAD